MHAVCRTSTVHAAHMRLPAKWATGQTLFIRRVDCPQIRDALCHDVKLMLQNASRQTFGCCRFCRRSYTVSLGGEHCCQILFKSPVPFAQLQQFSFMTCRLRRSLADLLQRTLQSFMVVKHLAELIYTRVLALLKQLRALFQSNQRVVSPHIRGALVHVSTLTFSPHI